MARLIGTSSRANCSIMAGDYSFRDATVDDIPFLVETIIEAEKSGTDILTYSTIFGFSEDEARHYISEMLKEEVDNCELSISSFLLAVKNNEIAGAVAAWVEGIDGISSAVLKGNLLNYVLPPGALNRAVKFKSFLRDIHIEYFPNTVQIGLVYVSGQHRGVNLSGTLIDQKIKQLGEKTGSCKDAYVQVFSNNNSAIRAYKKVNFTIVSEKRCKLDGAEILFPSPVKILMRRKIK